MKTRIILFFLILACSSCSSQILVPSWFDAQEDRKKHNWLDHQGITIIAENLEVTNEHFIFDVEIRNETNNRLRFYSEKVYYLGSDEPYPYDNQIGAREHFESKLEKHYALSERQVASHLERQIKSQKRTNLVTGILSAALIAFDVGMNVKNTNAEVTPKFLRSEAIRSAATFGGLVAMDVIREQSAMTAAKAREDLHYLPDEIIGEGVIMPGTTFRGKLFFPAGTYQYIRMILPVESTEYALDFRWASGKEQRKLYRIR